MSDTHSHSEGSYKSYTLGFAVSVILTLAAFYLVANHRFSRDRVIAAIVGLAVIQLLVQLLFFLHLGRESKPRWKQLVFYSMLTAVFILVAGSIWIMNNLNYNMRTPEQTTQYIIKDEGIH